MSIDEKSLRARCTRTPNTANSANGVHNMVALARSDLAVGPEELDTDCPRLFNVENGTIDLRTGELREHRKEDFITKLAPVIFDATATCPRWDEFLDTIFAGDEDLILYMQRLVGYCLTGVTEEHILPFLHGEARTARAPSARRS